MQDFATHVPTDHFCKGVLGLLLSVAGEQLQIGFVHVQKNNEATAENPTRIVGSGIEVQGCIKLIKYTASLIGSAFF